MELFRTHKNQIFEVDTLPGNPFQIPNSASFSGENGKSLALKMATSIKTESFHVEYLKI